MPPMGLIDCARAGLAAAVLAVSLAVPAAEAAAPKPSFEGVWVTYPGSDAVAFGFGSAKQLPFTPEAEAKVDEYQRLTAPTADNPGAFCLGSGMPASMLFSGGFPMEIVPGTDQVTILYEAHSEIRRVYLGKKVLPPADRLTDRNGYSVGRWEGDTLVVETDNLVEQVDQQYAHSGKAKIVERYRLITDGEGRKVLVNDWTLTDPVFYTQPVIAQKKWLYDPDTRILPYQCREQAWEDHLAELKAKAGGTAAAR